MITFVFALLAALPQTAPAPIPACSKPALVERPDVSAEEMRSLIVRAESYISCMSKAIETQRELANTMLERARSEAEKGNAMVVEVNAFVERVKALQGRQASQ